VQEREHKYRVTRRGGETGKGGRVGDKEGWIYKVSG
jgi:hypothetical protein